jgi:aryl-alcohol dehydrogenase-like predicted oxidoreductase
MRYRLLGNSGLRVSEAVLGTMTFGEEWGWGSAKEESRKVYDAFREVGARVSFRKVTPAAFGAI